MEGCFAIRPHFELEFHLCMRVHIYERLSARPLENWIPLLRKSTRAFDVNCSTSYSRGRHTRATRKVLCSNLHIVPSAGTKATPGLDCPPCAHHPAHYNTALATIKLMALNLVPTFNARFYWAIKIMCTLSQSVGGSTYLPPSVITHFDIQMSRYKNELLLRMSPMADTLLNPSAPAIF